MSMNLNTEEDIKKAYADAISSVGKKQIEHEARMIMYRVLSEVERLSDERNLNRKKLASLIGTSASYITQLFRGSKLLNLETIAKFQQVFGITFEIKAVANDSSINLEGIDVDIMESLSNRKNKNQACSVYELSPDYKADGKEFTVQLHTSNKMAS